MVPAVRIDDVTVNVKEGRSILDAAKMAGIWIPTLCHNPALKSEGTCRLCVVEAVGEEGRSLVTACNYPIHQDIAVSVAGDRATRAREGVMKLLLARSPESEELKDLAKKMGVNGTPYPSVTESQRSCILCGLCVVVCEEAIGVSAIGFAGKSVNRTVAAPFRQPSEDCIACGACAAVCPVGTIQVRIYEETGEAEISPFKSRKKLLVCNECGKNMVAEPVTAQMIDRVDFNWDEFRDLARICPDCRRKRAAKSLGYVDGLVSR